jgi:hypothetical protein
MTLTEHDSNNQYRLGYLELPRLRNPLCLGLQWCLALVAIITTLLLTGNSPPIAPGGLSWVQHKAALAGVCLRAG